jgi:hypothetical protein
MACEDEGARSALESALTMIIAPLLLPLRVWRWLTRENVFATTLRELRESARVSDAVGAPPPRWKVWK